jgi:enoyl-CoA hydratase/carnithine racemase
MNLERLKIEKKDHVVIMRILDSQEGLSGVVRLAQEIAECIIIDRSDKEIRVVILEEKGKGAFCIGEEILSKIPEVLRSANGIFSSIALSISKIEMPVIAGVEGDAVGSGLEWILACDLRIASETSRFGLPQIKTGVIPTEGGTQRLARLVGMGKALEMILTGELIDAQEALRIGLVNGIVPRGEVSNTVMAIAKDMASKSPISTRYAKEAICKGMDLKLDQGLRLEADLYYLMHTTRDRAEGIQAFQKKRKAQFEGR